MKTIFEICQRISEVRAAGGYILVRCAGDRGQQVAFDLRKAGIEPAAFLDHNTTRKLAVEGIAIEKPESVFDRPRGSYFVLIAIEDDGIYYQIESEYRKHGLAAGVDYADFSFGREFGRRMFSFIDIVPDYDCLGNFQSVAAGRMQEASAVLRDFDTCVPEAYNLIPNLDLPLTTACSLNCVYCSHSIPLAEPRHFSVDAVLDDLDKLLSVSYVTCLAIMGGEPFVYPQLIDFINKYNTLRNKKNIGFTRVVTNGTVLPSDDFFKAYKELSNAYIYISNYGDKSKNSKAIAEKAEKYGVKTYLCPMETDWMSLGDCSFARQYSAAELQHLYAVCGSHACVQLFDGHLYACGRVPVLNEDGVIPYAETDFCDVRGSNEKELKEKLHQYLFQKPYLEGCRYCDGQHRYSAKVGRGK